MQGFPNPKGYTQKKRPSLRSAKSNREVRDANLQLCSRLFASTELRIGGGPAALKCFGIVNVCKPALRSAHSFDVNVTQSG